MDRHQPGSFQELPELEARAPPLAALEKGEWNRVGIGATTIEQKVYERRVHGTRAASES
jgi:hypothetical protein